MTDSATTSGEHWVTVHGRHLLIGKGQSIESALQFRKASADEVVAQKRKDAATRLSPPGESPEVAKSYAFEDRHERQVRKSHERDPFHLVDMPVEMLTHSNKVFENRMDRQKTIGGSKDPGFVTIDRGPKDEPVYTIDDGNHRVAYAKSKQQKTVPMFVQGMEEGDIERLRNDIEAWKKKQPMNTPQTINLDRGTQGDEGHFVQIDGHPVFIKDDTGHGANGRGGSFTKHGLEKKLMKHHESRGGFAAHEHRGAMADDSGGDLMGKSRFTFHKTLPGEVRKHIENNPAARKLFRVSANAADAKGADALASMGDKYFQMADEAAGGHMTQAIESARKSDDPEARFHAAMYAELPKTKVTQGLISPDKLREGHNFTVNGRAIHVVNDNGTLTLDGGSDWPSTPVQAMSEIPIDKHSLKMGKKAMSVEKEVIPFSRTIELSQGALFDKTDKSKGASGGQGHLYGGKSTKDRDGHDGHWVTIHGAKVFIKHGQSVGKALREHFGDSKPVTHEHVSHAAKQVEAQGGKANVEPKDKPTEPKDIVRGAAERAAQVVDPNRQLGMFAKDKDGNAMEVGEKPGQAALFHDTPKAAPVVDKVQAKRDEDAKATAEMFPATKPETVPGDTGKIGSMHPDLVTKPAARKETYINGDRGEYTGKTQQIHGGTFHEVEMMEGRDKGKTKVTQRGPDGSDPHADVRKTTAAEMQAGFKRLADSQKKPTARDTIDAAKGGDETPDSYDFTRTEARDIRADAAKRAAKSKSDAEMRKATGAKGASARFQKQDDDRKAFQKTHGEVPFTAKLDDTYDNVIVAKSTKQSGSWQATFFKDGRPISDLTSASHDGAMSALQTHYGVDISTVQPVKKSPPLASGGVKDATEIGSHNLRDVFEHYKQQHIAEDQKMSPNRAGELAAVRVRTAIREKLNDIGTRARKGMISAAEEIWYDNAMGAGDSGKKWDFGRELETISGSRTMGADADHPAANRPLADSLSKKPTTLSASKPETLYLSAGTLEKSRPDDIPDDAPTYQGGLKVHYRWQDAALAGKWVHPVKGMKIDIDASRLNRWADNINLARSRGVAIPICKDHVEKADATMGYIYAARSDGNTLKLLNGYLGQESLRTARKNFLSVGIDPSFRDSEGNHYGEAIRHVAVTPVPVIPRQKGFIAASREDAQPDEVQYLVPMKETDMKLTDDERSKIVETLGIEAVDDESAVSLLTDTIDELSREVSEANQKAVTLSAELDAEKAKLIELSAAKPAEPVIVEHKPDARDVESAKLRIELSATKGDIPAWLGKALTAKLESAPLLLSREGDGKPTFVTELLDLFNGSKLGVKTEEKTGVQMLSREVPDGDTSPTATVNPYQDTIAKLTGAAR